MVFNCLQDQYDFSFSFPLLYMHLCFYYDVIINVGEIGFGAFELELRFILLKKHYLLRLH